MLLWQMPHSESEFECITRPAKVTAEGRALCRPMQEAGREETTHANEP